MEIRYHRKLPVARLVSISLEITDPCRRRGSAITISSPCAKHWAIRHVMRSFRNCIATAQRHAEALGSTARPRRCRITSTCSGKPVLFAPRSRATNASTSSMKGLTRNSRTSCVRFLGKPKVCQPERLRQRKERHSLTYASSKPTRIGTPACRGRSYETLGNADLRSSFSRDSCKRPVRFRSSSTIG